MKDFDLRKFLAKNPLTEAYTPGSGWTQEFDYDDMLAHGLKLNADSPLEDLEKVAADFEDVNYHREAEPLFYAIDAIKAGDRGEAKMYINKFHKELKKTIADYSNEYFDVNEAELPSISDEQVAAAAQAVADAFTAEDNELDLTYVITPDSLENDLPRGGGFDLDVEAGPNTPGDDWKDENGFGISNYLGKYAGGSFMIKPAGNRYEIRNAAMRSALVAYLYPDGKVEIVPAGGLKEGDLIGNIGKGLDYEETLDKIKDYADRLLGADVEDVEDLMDFYLDNPADLPEPLEYNFFKNNYDDILYYATTGKDELDAKDNTPAIDRMYNSDAWVQAQRDMMEAEGEVMVDAKLLASYIDAMLEYADEEYTPNILKSLKDLKSKLSGKMSVKDALDFVKKTIDITGDDIDAIEALGQATDYDDAVIAQARKIMGIDENKKSNKMKKSELKEMIRQAMLAETTVEEMLNESPINDPRTAQIIQMLRDMEVDGETMEYILRQVGIEDQMANQLVNYPAEYAASLKEADEEVDVEADAEETADAEVATDDVAVDDTETVDVETTAEISPEVKATQDALTAAIEAAKALGDKKLADQIGNSITFFTRTHVVGKSEVAETVDLFELRMLKNAGIKK